ncbi:MAG: thioredoxin [Candidatus Kerfeldbacteria bacterium]|nr:thioredoxin [Candidatus Kerfeldbacteria bacterium]
MPKVIVNDNNFSPEVLQEANRPVLVDFWATWCYPCRVQGPIVDELAKEFGDKVKVAKLEVDDSPTTTMKYGVLSIPTLAIFKAGKLVWQGVGVHQKNALAAELQKHL